MFQRKRPVGFVPGLVSAAALLAVTPAWSQDATFESLLGKASTSIDLGTLVSPFLDDCVAARRSIDRVRCEGVNRFLKTAIPDRSFAMKVDDADSVTVSDYDARIKGVSVGVIGCLACNRPVKVGAGGQMRLVTLRPPDKAGASLQAAVEVARASLTFGGIPESKVWLEQVRPHLRAEFVFQPENKEWSFGPSRGFAFKMLGARVFNHCTGDVVYSQPPSSGAGPKYSQGKECSGAGGAGDATADNGVPAQLDAGAINRAMASVRPLLDECVAQFDLRGSANIRFEVSGTTGIATAVTLEGSLGGTELGNCLIAAARKARFNVFKRELQKFTYPVMLKRKAG